jgi:hypothetical protein
MASVAQIVRNLIEQLSESVSDLVFNVVLLQEQNAEMPPHLPQAAAQVMQTASMLVKVAHQLASVNYKNFEEIANEIRTAADAVTGASSSMTTAIKVIAESKEKKTGWSSLTEACRLMAGKTIKLLQIVYAADLKRLFAVANAVHKDLGKMDTALALSSPDDFAEWATALATKANQLATYLQARSKDETSPVTKAKLDEFATKLKFLARELVNKVNDLLEEPESGPKRTDCERVAKELEKTIEEVGLFLLETQTEMPDFQEGSLDSLAEAMRKRKIALEDAARRLREEAEAAEAQRIQEAAAQRREAALRAALDAVEAPDRTSDLAAHVLRAQAALKRLQEMAFAGDVEGTRLAATEAAEALAALTAAAREEANKTLDPARRQQILNSIKHLEQALPTQLALAKKLLDAPTEEDKVALRKINGNADAWLAEILDATRTDDLLERASRADRAAELIAKAVADRRAADDRQVLGEDFARLNDKVVHIAKFQAQNAFSDQTRQQLQDAIARLASAAGNLTALSHMHDDTDPDTLNASATAAAAAEYRAALASLQSQANAQALGTLAAVVRDLDGLHRHALAENRTGMQAASLQMIKDGKQALENAKKVAALPGWTENPDERERLVSAIQEVDARLKDQMVSVRGYMETGTAAAQSAKRKEALTKMMLAERPARDAIAYLEQILSGQVPEMEYMESPGNEAAIAKSALELNDMAGQIIDLARVVKDQNAGTSEARDATTQLEQLLSSIQSESNAIIETLAEHDPDERIVAKAAETVEYIRQLREAASDTPAALVNASHRLANMIRELQGEVAQKVATTHDAEQAAQLEAQNKAIGELLADTVRVTKSVLSDGLSEHKGAFDAKTHLLKRAVQRTAGVVRPEDHDERVMRDTYSQLQLKLKEVAAAVASKDTKKVNDDLQVIDKVGKEYLRAAQKRKAKRKNGFISTSEADPLAEFRALAKRIGHPARDAAEKGDSTKAEELDEVTDQIKKVAKGNNDDHAVDKIAAFQDVDATMAAIETAVERSDGERVTILTKRLISQMEFLPPIAEGEKDAEVKRGLREAVVELNDKVRDAVQRAAACIRAPGDESLFPVLGAAVDAARVPTARAIALLSPCEDRGVAEQLRVAQAAVSAQGPVAAVTEIRKAIDLSASLAAKDKDEHKRRHVEQAVTSLQEKLEELSGPGETVTALDVQESLEDLYHMVHTGAKTDVVELAGAVKGGASEIDADLKEAAKPGNTLDKNRFHRKTVVLNTKMADLRDSALGVSKGTAMPPTLLSDPAVAKISPDSLDGFLDVIEKSFTPPKSVDKSVQELLDAMKDIKREDPKTFEEALERAAVDIAQAVQASSQTSNAPEMIASSGIAGDMARLAKAAREGNKTEMMLAAKAIAAHLTQLINEVNTTIKKLGNGHANEVDRLMRQAAAMKNFGTQLRILTSVKAASIETDADNDETLLSVTKGLGNIVTDSIKQLDITKRVILKQR